MDQNTIYIAVAVVVLLVVVLLLVNRRKRPAAHDTTRRVDHQDTSDESRLAHLADLRSKGLVTEEEFESQRRQILGKL